MRSIAHEFEAVLLTMYGPRVAHLDDSARDAYRRMFFAGWLSAIVDNVEMGQKSQAAALTHIRARKMECKQFFGITKPDPGEEPHG